ncbi:MAG: sporulation protein YunB [Thermobacillus sp. ZCTH02-B1]|uniref:sporulation protein YunB n=1 Tax=Thermobacillus sp. ZCTH02-B1 TaxID=1858795 RepID=UPI000B55CFEA|nr:sporulation protein YunB [Thermobacillus sp. ZCTH02-B1]OUM94373.1 MAG: sporulation protein YunB [Thermobacillus sp. ZCTH02-B1]
MARRGGRGIARLLGALLAAGRPGMRFRARRRPGARFVPGGNRSAFGARFVPGGSLSASGDRFVPARRPVSGGGIISGGRPAAAARPSAGGRFVARRRRTLSLPSFLRQRDGRRQSSGSARSGPDRPGGKGRRIGGKRLVLIVFLSFLAFTVFAFVYVERHLRPPLMHVATMRVKQIVTQAINEAIMTQVASRTDAERLVEWQKSEDGRVTGFMLNYAEHMRITSETVETVQRTLYEIKHVPEYIPIGQAFGSAVIASFGPRMPVRFEPVGAAKVELGTRQRDAGINMILVEVFVRITAEMAIIIPFDTKPETVVTEIPISYLLVVGDVPMYYFDNKGNPGGSSADHAPNIALTLPPSGDSATSADPAGDESGEAAPEQPGEM